MKRRAEFNNSSAGHTRGQTMKGTNDCILYPNSCDTACRKLDKDFSTVFTKGGALIGDQPLTAEHTHCRCSVKGVSFDHRFTSQMHQKPLPHTHTHWFTALWAETPSCTYKSPYGHALVVTLHTYPASAKLKIKCSSDALSGSCTNVYM